MIDIFHVFPVPYSFPSYHLTLHSLRSQQHTKINKQIHYSDHATGWMIRSMNPGWGTKFFFSSKSFRLDLLLTKPSSSLVFSGYWGSFPMMKRPRHEVDHSHLSPRFRMCGVIPPIPLYIVSQTGKTLTSMHTANINTTKKLAYIIKE